MKRKPKARNVVRIRNVAKDFRALSRLVEKLHKQLTVQGGRLAMKTLAELTKTIETLGKKESDYQKREDAIVAALTKQVDDLKAAAAKGTAVDVSAQVAQLEAIIAAIPSDVPPTVVPADKKPADVPADKKPADTPPKK